MNPWTPIPLGLATDLRAARLPLAARGALLDLYLAAHAGPDRAVVAVGAGDAATIARQLWGGAGPAALAALVAAGLLFVDPGAWRLALVAGPGVTSSAEVLVSTTAIDGAASDDGRRASRHRDARYRFARRERRWADVPPGVTWEAWLASPEGQAWDRGDAARDGGATPCDASRDGGATVAATPCDGDASQRCDASPSHSPSSPEEEKQVKQAQNTHLPERATRDGGATRDAPATPCDASRDGGATVAATPVVACPTVESTGYTSAELLADLRARAPRAIGTGCDSATEAALQRVMLDLVGRSTPEATPEGYRTLADWIGAGGFGWWTHSARPSVAYLARPGTLAKALDDAAQWAAAGRPKIVHGQGAAPTTSDRRPPSQTAARGLAPVAPPGSYARPARTPDPAEKYLVQPLQPTGTAR